VSAPTAFAAHRQAALEFLRAQGTDRTPHIFGDLLEHLVGVEALVRQWGGSDLLALVALGHATYGTDGFAPLILELDDRPVLAGIIGPEAEALVYFYASCDRTHFYPQLADPATERADLAFRDRFTGLVAPPEADALTVFMDLTYANEAELAAASPGGPAEWTWLRDFCRQTSRWASPSFADGALALLDPAA
jgi:hypothetical protein